MNRYRWVLSKVLLWPVLLVGAFLFLELSLVFSPCDSGFFIGGCTLGKTLISLSAASILVIYVALSFLILRTSKKPERLPSPTFFLVFVGSAVVFFLLAGSQTFSGYLLRAAVGILGVLSK